ncbi:MAG: VCBS repeat-containing protein [Acidobacteria bacterium]|nr:VCBS repeat-containing protein [Acidobacteriota bacterium]
MTPAFRQPPAPFTRAALLGLLLLAAVFVLFSFTPRQAVATQNAPSLWPGAPAPSPSALNPSLLNADGTLKSAPDLRGSFDARGWRMATAANGAPRFLAPAVTCDENWDTQFYAPGPVGQVNAVAISATGDVYVGGTFTLVGTVSANRIAKWNGSVWSALGSGLNSDVLALAVSGNDVYAGGTFTTAGGANIKGVAKWNGSAWSALGTGLSSAFNPNVGAIAISGANVYVGGVFSTAGGVTVNNVAVWNGSTWAALGPGLTAPPFAGQVFALALNGTELYAGGDFTAAGGVTVNRVARWDGSAWTALGTGANTTVNALAWYGGELVAGGAFTTMGGVSANLLARWNGSTWATLGSGASGASSSVKVLTVRGGNLVAGGKFVTAGGITVNNIAEWNGTSWAALGNGVAASGTNLTVAVYALAATGGDVYVGGDFRGVGGPNVSNLARWNGAAWAALGGGGKAIFTSYGSSNIPPYITAVTVQGNNVYVGGQFAVAGGVTANNIVKWDGTQWSALGNGLAGGAGSEVRSIAVSANGDVYAGGNFTITVGGVATRGIAKWNGTSWVALSGGLSSGGGTVNAIAIIGNDVYAGGSFTTACSNAACTTFFPASGIAKWDGSAWSALGSGIGGSISFVFALAVSGNNLYLGGRYDTAGGVTANGIAKWNGSAWSALGSGIGPSLQSNTVRALAVRGNELYVGGLFTSAGGVPADSIAKWNESTSTWSALGSGIPSHNVNALAVSGNSIYATGDFVNAGGLTGVNELARWDAVNNTWSAVGSGLGGGFNSSAFGTALAAAGGQFYLGGNFTTAGGQQAQFFAHYSEGTAVIATPPANQTVCPGQPATFTAAVSGGNGTLSYQWRKNGANIAGATSSSYTTSAVTLGDNGALFDLVAVNACGASVVSTAATLTVNNPPTITAQPVAATVCAGDTASFSVSATGATGYQWRKNGAPLSGANAATLIINNAQPGDAGAYAVDAVNACGTITSNAATLIVNTAPVISAQPASQTLCAGGTATFSVTALGATGYQWKKDGSSITGATAATLTISNAQAADAGAYTVDVSNGCGTTASGAAALSVNAVTAITAQPAGQTVCNGAAASLAVSATGTNLSYQWRKDGVDISGATGSSFTIATATAADAANYDVVVTGACGSLTSAVATLTVNAATAIAMQPTSQTVCAGTAATFSVAASGTALTYQWRKDGVNIGGANGNSYTATDAGSYDVIVSGACGTVNSSAAALTVNALTVINTQPASQTVCAGTSATFSVAATGASLTYQWRKDGANIGGANGSSYNATDAANYDVVVSGACGTATSSAATLTVNATTAINIQPASQPVCAGASATFSVGAIGTNLSYQWRRDGASIGGANGNSFTIAAAAAADAASYDVVVSGACGALTSSPATLTINATTAINTQPANQASCPGGAVTFAVNATGTNLSYQWRKGGASIGGANGSSYTIAAVMAGDAASYDVIVSGACGSVTSSPASLTLSEATAINTQPANQTACPGGAATFGVAASGAGAVSYQWRKGGVSIGGANAASLTINPVSAADAGNYEVVVNSTCGSVTSSAATLTVNTTTAITTQPVNQTACTGASATFNVAATGTSLTYQWRKGGVNISGANGGSYSIAAITVAEAASYDVLVTGACGSVTSTAASLTVNAVTAITTQPTNQTACAGSAATFSVTATGTGLSYQWRKGGVNISGATGSSYSIAAATAADAANYDVVVSGACGSATSTVAALTVNPATAITTQPASLTRTVGQSASFTVTATGASLTYQWRKNGNNISGATASSYTIAAVTNGDAGNYDVMVGGACGSVTSGVAVLTVGGGACAAPVVSLSAPASEAVYAVGAAVSFSGAFTDSGGAPHTATWSFGALTRPGVVNEGAGTVSASYTFTQPGVYPVLLTVGNQCGQQGTATTIGGLMAQVVIYDPCAGFVTGGGWINSPAGAYTSNPALIGKAEFSFSAKYKKRRALPEGATEFSFGAANFKFKSISYAWLVVAGARAQYRGTGKVNNAGDYRFLLTVIDGQQPGGGGQDKLRLKVWNQPSGALVYDTQLNAPDNAPPATVLGGGSIVIHQGDDDSCEMEQDARNDFDGDGRSDLFTWNDKNGRWLIARSSDGATQAIDFGAPGDVPVPGDYDGDGQCDVAVFRPANGTWYARLSASGQSLVKAWGMASDVPVPGDYDGDGRTDLAVWRGGEGRWYIARSADGAYEIEAWGAAAAPYLDVPVPGDYDGDGRTDLAVFRRGSGEWFVKLSRTGTPLVKAWGLGSDTPVAADYDGDGKTDIAVWRGSEGNWYIRRSADGAAQIVPWGAGYAPYWDVPVTGDYDGDGQADLTVWRLRESRWYVRYSTDQSIHVQAQGQPGEAPLPAPRQ